MPLSKNGDGLNLQRNPDVGNDDDGPNLQRYPDGQNYARNDDTYNIISYYIWSMSTNLITTYYTIPFKAEHDTLYLRYTTVPFLSDHIVDQRQNGFPTTTLTTSLINVGTTIHTLNHVLRTKILY